MLTKYLTGLFCYVCFFTFIGPIYADEAFKFKGNRKRDQISFIKAGGLIVLKTFLNDKGPYNFILDSGVGLIIITDPALKDDLGLSFTKEIKIAGLGELPDFSAFLSPNIKINIANTEAKSLGAVILKDNLEHLSQYAGIPIHGLIGFDFFDSFTVKTFYEAGYVICESKHKQQTHKKGFKIPISIERKKPYCKIGVTLKNKHLVLKALVDSGVGHALALESLDNKDFPLPDNAIRVSLGIGLNGEINGFLGRISSFELGGMIIPHLLSSFPSYEDVAEKTKSVVRNGSIGNRLLKNFNVTYHYYKSYIHLQPLRKKFPLLEHDMSGLEIIATGKAFDQYVINKIDLHDQSKYANLKIGDELISIDQNLTSNMSLEDINNLLTAEDGQEILIKVKRNNSTISTIITLKKVI